MRSWDAPFKDSRQGDGNPHATAHLGFSARHDVGPTMPEVQWAGDAKGRPV
ncbi:hypothetical protein ART_3154 [Arthrobacter sp. PAMC 25486]|nr:hypothetical protein ART_3154 [Arthrobacter sp. PAMC 25486]